MLCTAGTYDSAKGTGQSSSVCKTCPVSTTLRSDQTGCQPQAGYYDLGSSLIGYYTFDSGGLTTDASGSLGPLIVPSPAGAPTSVADGPWTGSQAVQFTQNCGAGATCVSSLASPPSRSQLYKLPAMTLGAGFSICLWYRPGDGARYFERLIELSRGRNLGDDLVITRSVLVRLAVWCYMPPVE